MIIKKGIFILFAFLFGFLALNSAPVEASDNYFSNSLEAEGNDCGVASGDMVASVSFSICKEDLAYNVIYMAFSKVFNQFDVLKAFVFENAGSLDQEGYASNMGGAILAIILGITQVVFIVGAIILGLATVKVIYNSMTSGDFLGKGVNKVWVILRSLLVIFMIFPLGTVSFAQLCVLMIALFAIMGGNFFYGIFLSTVQKEAMVAENGPSVENQADAISQSDALINAALCQNRTLKAIRDKNFTKYESKWIGSVSFEDQMSRLSNCIAPQSYSSYPLTTFSANPVKEGNVDSITIGKVTNCEGVFDTVLLSKYDPEYHGYPFSCGNISFSNPRISDETSTANGQSDADAWFLSATRDAISKYAADQYNSYGLKSKLASYYSKAGTIKSGQEFDYRTLDSEINALAGQLTTAGKTLYNSVKAETDHNTAVKSLYVANSILLNNLLGGKSPSAESVIGLKNAASIAVTGVVELGKTLNDRYAMKANDSFAMLEKYSVNAASALDQVHCLQNFNNVASSIQVSKVALTSNTESSFSDFIKKPNSVFSGECLWFNSTSGSEKINPRYAVEGFSSPSFSAGDAKIKITMGPAGSLVSSKIDENAVAAKMNTDVVGMTMEAQINKMALASHFYVVREAIKRSMVDVLAESTDKELPKKMRKQGFASFGGFILQISNDQTNLNKYMKKINTGVKWSAFSEGGQGLYVENAAFGEVDMSTEANKLKFIPMVVVDFFAAGSSTSRVAAGAATGGNSGSSGDDDFINSIFNTIEDGLTGPMIYLKKMGGTDLNLPLRAGVEKCFKEGNCYPGDIHPVNALSYMGIDLMDTAIKFYMLKIAVNLVAKILDFDGGEGSTSKNSGVGKILNILATALPVGKVVKYGVMAADGIVNFLAPIFALLFLAGVFFGYMLPILPYVAFLIMFLGWIVYIFELMITVPIWLIMMAIPGPGGQPRGNLTLLWQYTGLLLLKPALMVIGLIFGWYFSVLSIFFINMTFFGVMGTVFDSHSSFSVMGIIDVIMFYFVYLVIVFVALKHSFSIISSFPQTVAEAIELRGYADKQAISSVGAEQLLGLAIVGKVKGAVTEAVSNAGRKFDSITGLGDEQKHKKQMLDGVRREARQQVDRSLSGLKGDSNRDTSSNSSDSGFNGSSAGSQPSNTDTKTSDKDKKKDDDPE
jgi:conjugal transfer/type IV secretion protein DotA/TraY